MEIENAWKKYSEKQLEELEALNNSYMEFLDKGKTERECVDEIVSQAKAAGYKNLEDIIKKDKKLKAGDKVYSVWMKKSVALFIIGKKPMEEGMNILGAHIDSPRIDIKQNPLYEDTEIAYLDTHYYGGIKKYQWVTLPLAIHGVVVKKDGTVINIVIGEEENDPVFFISDLLIHLAQEQIEKKASKVIEGEDLNIIIGTKPLEGEEKDAVKKQVIKLINEKYGFEEEDFISAELEVVPAGKAKEAGLDRSMVLAYGQDDRVCAYTSLAAMLEFKKVERTACCILVDKEENSEVLWVDIDSALLRDDVPELTKKMIQSATLKQYGLQYTDYNGNAKHAPYSLYTATGSGLQDA